MDFKRIQLLLITFFLVFDFYLGHMLVTRIGNISQASSIPAETSIEEDLSARNIQFSPLDHETGEIELVKTTNTYIQQLDTSQITDQTIGYENNILQSQLNTPLDLGIQINDATMELSQPEEEHIYQNVLSNTEVFASGDLYTQLMYIPNERLIIARMDHEGFELADGTAEIRLFLNENYQLTRYTQTFQHQIKALPTTIHYMSERTAVEILDRRVETYIPNDSKLIYNQLVYYQSMHLEDFSVYSPAWEITYMDSGGSIQTIMVDASRGTVINRDLIMTAGR